MNYNKIKQRREELNYTQEYVAGQMGISQNHYSVLESGRSQMKVEQLILIAKILDTDPNEFLQHESLIVNMDNAKIEHGSGAYFSNGSITNHLETNQEIIGLLKGLTELLGHISERLKKEQAG